MDDERLSELSGEMGELSDEMEEASRRAEEALERGWRADCGSSPYCLRERAASLASLGGTLNPNYPSPAGWTFAAPLLRARNYYAARLSSERVSGSNAEQITDAEYTELYSMAAAQSAHTPDHEDAKWRNQDYRLHADLEESVGQLLEGSGGDEPAPDAPDGSADKPIEAYRGMTYYKDKYYLDPEDSNTYICTRDRDDAPGTGLALYYLPHELAGIYFQAVESE